MDLFNLALFLFTCWVTTDLCTADDLFYFDPSPVGQDVVEGEPAWLRCDVSNRHLVAFYWTLDGKPLANGTRRYQEGSDLKIVRVDRVKDSGSFRCVATNVSTGAAIRSSEAFLNISWISDEMAVQETEEGGWLKCVVDGNPEPTIVWMKNGITVQSSERVRISRQRLRVQRPVPSHWGVYSCRAHNDAGSVESLENFLLYNNNNRETTFPKLLSPSTFTRPQYVSLHADARLDCNFQGSLSTEWSLNDSKINSNSFKYTLFTNGTLAIKQVTPRDTGTYTCSLSNISRISNSSSISFATRLTIPFLDEMSEKSMDPTPSTAHVVPINSRSEVKCYPPTGLPKPAVRWLKPNGQAIETDGRMSSKGGVLILTSAEEKDSGIYSCVVENQAAVRRLDLEIVVTVPPKVQRLSTVETVQEGEPVTFECRYSGTVVPFTSISWKKNGAVMEPTKDSRVQIASTRLRIASVLSSDEGSYGCVVSTRGQSPVHVHVAQLYVASRLKFLIMPSVVQLEMGTTGHIPCFAEGKTPPVVYWKKFGTLLSSPSGADHPQSGRDSSPLLSPLPDHVSSENGVLKFAPVRREDSGLYVCFAASTQGNINFTVKVDVIVKPFISSRPRNVTVSEMGFLVVNCKAGGDPLPSLEWIKNLRMNFIDHHRVKAFENGSLVFGEVHFEDIGWYTCSAFSETGSARQEFYIDVVDARGVLLPEVDENYWAGRRMTLVAIGCSVIYVGIMTFLMTCCIVRRRKMRKKMIAEEIRRVQNDLLSAFSSSSSKSEKLSTVVSRENSQLMPEVPTPSGLLEGQHRARSNQSTFSRETDFKKNFKRDRLQIISHLGKSSYGDVLLARLLPSNLSLPYFSGSRVVMVKMLHDDGNQGERYGHDYDQLENIYDDVQGVSGTPDSLVTHEVLERDLLSSFERDHSSRNPCDFDLICSSDRDQTEDCLYQNLENSRMMSLRRQGFLRDLEILRLMDNQRCFVGYIGHCTSMRPHILVFEYSEKGNLRDFLSSFVQDQLPKMPTILTLDRQLHFCHQVALGMAQLNQVVRNSPLNPRLNASGRLSEDLERLMPFKNLAARNVVVTSCLDAKISLAGLCFDPKGPQELDEDHTWHDGQPLLLRWSAPELVARQSLSPGTPRFKYPSTSLSSLRHWPSDVWSYGVTLMEIFTFAARPFPDLNDSQVLLKLLRLSSMSSSSPNSSNPSTVSNAEVLRFQDDPQRIISMSVDSTARDYFYSVLGLKCPLGCPERLWQIVRQCLSPVPQDRPTFEDTVKDIEAIIRCINASS